MLAQGEPMGCGQVLCCQLNADAVAGDSCEEEQPIYRPAGPLQKQGTYTHEPDTRTLETYMTDTHHTNAAGNTPV
jgi:hypothetical protein